MSRASWTCRVCTFRHDDDNVDFLRCAMCNSSRHVATEEADNIGNDMVRSSKVSEFFCTNRKTASKIRKRHAVAPSAKSNIPANKKSCSLNDVLVRLPSSPIQVDGKSILDENLQKYCPARFQRNVLPAPVADSLLERLETVECPTRWGPRGSWTVFDKAHLIPRTSATYQLQPASGATEALGIHDDYENGNRKLTSFPELSEAALAIEQLVLETLPDVSTGGNNAGQTWKPTFCLANRYQDGNETVGMHSDYLNPLGPRPIIAGLSLGASRIFRLQHQDEKSKTTTTVNITMPHNSVVIMYGDCQEQWQHGVPRVANSSIASHSLVSKVRISLTFRMTRSDIVQHPKCHCGLEAKLKASRAGRYYYSCSPSSADLDKQRCNFYEACPWAEEEALAMRARDKSLQKEDTFAYTK